MEKIATCMNLCFKMLLRCTIHWYWIIANYIYTFTDVVCLGVPMVLLHQFFGTLIIIMKLSFCCVNKLAAARFYTAPCYIDCGAFRCFFSLRFMIKNFVSVKLSSLFCVVRDLLTAKLISCVVNYSLWRIKLVGMYYLASVLVKLWSRKVSCI